MVALVFELDRAGGSGFGGGDLCIESALEKGVTASATGLVFPKMMHGAKVRARFGADDVAPPASARLVVSTTMNSSGRESDGRRSAMRCRSSLASASPWPRSIGSGTT